MREEHTQEEAVLKRAVWLYALYRLYNCIRFSHFSPQEFHEAFQRYVKEGLR